MVTFQTIGQYLKKLFTYVCVLEFLILVSQSILLSFTVLQYDRMTKPLTVYVESKGNIKMCQCSREGMIYTVILFIDLSPGTSLGSLLSIRCIFPNLY